MTAFPIGVEVSCDGPDEQTECPDSAAVRAQFTSRTARQVRADGWTTRRVPGHLRDVCPACGRARQAGARPTPPPPGYDRPVPRDITTVEPHGDLL